MIAGHSISSVSITSRRRINVAPVEVFSGGYEYERLGRRRTREDVRKAREEYGIFEKVIQTVALRQSEDLHLDSQQRIEELTRELKLKGLEVESKHIQLLNEQREQFISLEIGKILRKKINDEDEALIMLIAMSL